MDGMRYDEELMDAAHHMYGVAARAAQSVLDHVDSRQIKMSAFGGTPSGAAVGNALTRARDNHARAIEVLIHNHEQSARRIRAASAMAADLVDDTTRAASWA